METIEKLTPESNLRVIVDTLNKFIEMGNINTKTLMTLTKSSGEPIKVFEATQNALITGEVYTLEMSGMYQIVTSGQGRTKAIIKDHKTDTVIDTIILNNAAQSKLYFLSEGDKVYVHSSPAGTSKMTTEFMVVQTMYDLMEESNIASIKQELDTKMNELSIILSGLWMTPKMFGAKGDGITDDTGAFISCINYCNNNKIPMLIPIGKYLIKTDLPQLKEGFTMRGLSYGLASSTEIVDMRNKNTPLITMGLNSRISDLSFSASVKNGTCIKVNGGWTSLIDSVKITNYLVALDMYKDDVFIRNCEIINCGGYTTKAYYAIELNTNCNHKRFDNCHFEHCRYFLRSGENAVENYFYGCKFEQSTNGLNTDLLAPIVVEGYWTNPRVGFYNCSFGVLYADAYLEGKSDISNYSEIPSFLNVAGALISACSFYGVPGSGTNICLTEHQTGILPIQAKGFTIIDGCTFSSLLPITDCIKMTEQSYCINSRLYLSTKKSNTLANNADIQRFTNGKLVFNCYSSNAAAINSSFNKSNKVITPSSDYAPLGTAFGFLDQKFCTVRIKMSTVYTYNLSLSVKVKAVSLNTNAVFKMTLNSDNGAAPVMSNAEASGVTSNPLNVYYDPETKEIILQYKGSAYSNMIIDIDGLEGYQLCAYNDLALVTECDKTLLGAISIF